MSRVKSSLRSFINSWSSSNFMLRILTGVIIGVILALLCPQCKAISFLGTLFVGALKAIAPVLVFVLVISAVSKARQGIGNRFRKVISLYLLTTFTAAVVAVFASRFFAVSISLSEIVSAGNTAPGALGDVFRNIINEIMSNPVKAIINANYLSILNLRSFSACIVKRPAEAIMIQNGIELFFTPRAFQVNQNCTV